MASKSSKGGGDKTGQFAKPNEKQRDQQNAQKEQQQYGPNSQKNNN
jgi:hypothetical protein